MIDLISRSKELELIDTEPLDSNITNAFLKDLERINQLTMAYRPTLKAIENILGVIQTGSTQRSVKILDVGCGLGDTLRKISQWAGEKNISVDLTGLDINPMAKKAAQAATPEEMKITYISKDVFDESFQETYDIIICSLFTHHLDYQSLIKFIKWMTDRSNYGWFINDLHRHIIPYYFIKYFVRLLRLNRLILNDAPLSVARSFSKSEWHKIIKEANLKGAKLTVSWRWPFRYCVLCLS
jgi:2-polyprenyl-3-methyl-5-hydroxy-6-metoxy-1,4-benzoquinol methylase